MVNARMLVLSAMCDPEWHPRMECHGMPHDDGAALVDRLITETRAAATSAAVQAILQDAALRETEGEIELAGYGRELAALISPDH